MSDRTYRLFGVEFSPKQSNSIWPSFSKDKTAFEVGASKGSQRNFLVTDTEFLMAFGVERFTEVAEDFIEEVHIGMFTAHDFIRDFLAGYEYSHRIFENLYRAKTALTIAAKRLYELYEGDFVFTIQDVPEGTFPDFELDNYLPDGESRMKFSDLLNCRLQIDKSGSLCFENGDKSDRVIYSSSKVSPSCAVTLTLIFRDLTFRMCEMIEESMFDQYRRKVVNRIHATIDALANQEGDVSAYNLKQNFYETRFRNDE
ncbi:hypothetical protein DEEACLCL_00133 [Salmonella phage CRW-SP2]|nr:hypothetical protein DEEACLCL_00133 [Salmonella phage CRW-SP2]